MSQDQSLDAARDKLKAHLEFFEELGIDGVRLDPQWHARSEPSEPTEPSEPSEPIPLFASQADLMFVGEAPGADEDIQGEPFVGRAGQLLTKIIESIALRREDVYIANVIKCRPPGNRNPEPDEVEQCEPFLFRQIDTVKPKVIVALGKFAAQCLLRTTDPITRIRGREFKYRDAILIPTYHPAYLLRTPSAKREVWEDMKRVRAILAGDD